MTKIPFNSQSFFFRLLTDSHFRIFRHIFLVLIIGVISFSQTLFSYYALIPVSGSNLYAIAFLMAILYLGVAYLHLYLFIPQFLPEKKYRLYLLCSVLSVMGLVGVDMIMEYAVYFHKGRPHLFNGVTVLDGLSSFALNMVCISGISMIVLLKYWMKNNQRITQLENDYIRTEVRQVKEQVNPPLLFHTLSRTASLVKEDPEQTSDILFRLSELLRYQLYDCAREKVLLSSDVTFLDNYLALEQLSSLNFTYSFQVDGTIGHLFIPPFLLLSFVQEQVQELLRQEQAGELQVKITLKDTFLRMEMISNKIEVSFNERFSLLRKRLDLFYPGGYTLEENSLSFSQRVISLELKLK